MLLPEARDAVLSVPRDGERIFRAKRGGDLTASTLAYYWQAISAVFGPVDPHELRHFAGHYLYVTKGLPARGGRRPARPLLTEAGRGAVRTRRRGRPGGDRPGARRQRRAAAAGGGRVSQTPGRHLGRPMPLYEAKLRQSPRLHETPAKAGVSRINWARARRGRGPNGVQIILEPAF